MHLAYEVAPQCVGRIATRFIKRSLLNARGPNAVAQLGRMAGKSLFGIGRIERRLGGEERTLSGTGCFQRLAPPALRHLAAAFGAEIASLSSCGICVAKRSGSVNRKTTTLSPLF